MAREGFPWWEAGTAIGTFLLAAATWYLASETKKAVNRQIAAQQQVVDQQLAAQQALQDALVKERSLAQSVDLIIKFTNQWESKEMMKTRQQFCALLKAREPKNDYAGRLLSFFETLGIVVNHASIEFILVWHEFCYHGTHYYLLLSASVDTMREQDKDKTLYNQFQRLYDELIKFDAKQRNVEPINATPNSEDLMKFIESERCLRV